MYRLPMDTIVNANTLLGDIDMTLHGDPVLVDGVRGKALSFNGDDQYAEIAHHRYITSFYYYFKYRNIMKCVK